MTRGQMTEERQLREQNIIWTINRAYDFVPEPELIGHTAIDALDRYRSILLGELYRETNADRTISYRKRKKQATGDAAIFAELFALALEERMLPKLKKRFEGVEALAREAAEQALSFDAKKRKRTDVSEEIRYAYYAHKSGSVPKTNRRVMELLSELLTFSAEDEDLPQKLDALLEKHFHFQRLAELLDGQEAPAAPEPKKERTRTNIARKTEFLVHEEQVMSAEFNQTDIDKILEQAEKDMAEAPFEQAEADRDALERRIIERYGPPSVAGGKRRELEKELSVGLHSGERLHITDRFTQVEGYRKKVLTEQTQINIENYNYQNHIFRRNISKMSNELKKILSQDLEYSRTKLDNGLIMPERAWRREVLGAQRIFYKNIRDTRGEAVVDILLDASGSQADNQSRVAAQAYIIAQALSQVNVPCRVSSFNNLFDYTVLKIYRDYLDPPTRNKRIFSYMAEGSNRDGYAIAAVGKMLLQMPQEHRILIVLSDGKPNDERVGGHSDSAAARTSSYTGDAAIEDTARRIRALRAKGVAVLGVFTGKDTELKAQQKIFGKDFAYIRQSERFSDVVGYYLKKHLETILETG